MNLRGMVSQVTPTMETARLFEAAGISFLRIKADGLKAPKGDWKEYQDRMPTAAETDSWFGRGLREGIGAIAGKVSRLLLVDIESEAAWEIYRTSVEAAGLLEHLEAAPLVKCPGGGRHVYLRCGDDAAFITSGNVRVLNKDIETPKDHALVAELRWEGHYCIAPGSPANVHPTKNLYQWGRLGWLENGTPESGFLPAGVFEQLYKLVLALGTPEANIKREHKTGAAPVVAHGESVIKRFNSENPLETLLVNAGWREVGPHKGSETLWLRPGKATGHSAIMTADRRTLYNFSSSADVVPIEKFIDAFEFYARQEHGGDKKKASKAFIEKGRPAAFTGYIDPPAEVAQANQAAQEIAGRRKLLLVEEDEQFMRREVMAVLGNDDRLFRQNGMLVTPREQDDVGGTVLAAANQEFVRALISERFLLRKTNAKGETRDALCPSWLPKVLVGAATDAALVPCREISGVLNGPALDSSGNVWNENGYAQVNGRGWYCAGHTPGLNEALPSQRITRESAQAAERRICNLVEHFPWADDYGYPMWLAALLAQVCRPLFDTCPATLITATAPGSGKSYLAKIIGIIAHGREPGMMPWPKHRENADTDNELRKRIMGLAATGSTLAVIDNLEAGCAFDSDALCAAVTSTLLEDRTLGVNGVGSIQTRRVWAQIIATGNAVVAAGDMADRTMVIKLQSNEANRRELPLEAFGKVGDALTYARTHRVQLLADCLTMAAGFIDAGKPRQQGKPWNSFNGFHDLILGIVRWTTGIDPIAKRLEGARVTDPVMTALVQLAANWQAVFGKTPVTARYIETACTAQTCGEDFAALGESLQALGAGQKLSAIGIGKTLKRYKDRVFMTDRGTLAIQSIQDTHSKTQAWTVNLTGS